MQTKCHEKTFVTKNVTQNVTTNLTKYVTFWLGIKFFKRCREKISVTKNITWGHMMSYGVI